MSGAGIDIKSSSAQTDNNKKGTMCIGK